MTETCDDARHATARTSRTTQRTRRGQERARRGLRGRGIPEPDHRCRTTDDTVPNSQITAVIDHALAGKNLAPARSISICSHRSVDLAVAGLARHGIALIGSMRADPAPQARGLERLCQEGFRRSTTTAEEVDLPQGKNRGLVEPVHRAWHGRDRRAVRRCDRGLGLRHDPADQGETPPAPTPPPRDPAEAQAAAAPPEIGLCSRLTTRRAGVEALMDQAVATEHVSMPPRATSTRLDHVYMACALNLLRLEAYWNGTPLDRRRTSHLARLELSLAA